MRIINKNLIFAILLCVSLLTGCETNDHIRVYNEFLRTVSKEHIGYAEELYNQFSDDIEEIWIAEDSRSDKCIRFAVISEIELADEFVREVLKYIHNAIQTEAMKKNIVGAVEDSIELFFISGDSVEGVYVSTIDKQTMDDQNITYNIYADWVEINYAEQHLTYNAVLEMMQCTEFPMFEINQFNLLQEKQDTVPDLPPYRQYSENNYNIK